MNVYVCVHQYVCLCVHAQVSLCGCMNQWVCTHMCTYDCVQEPAGWCQVSSITLPFFPFQRLFCQPWSLPNLVQLNSSHPLFPQFFPFAFWLSPCSNLHTEQCFQADAISSSSKGIPKWRLCKAEDTSLGWGSAIHSRHRKMGWLWGGVLRACAPTPKDILKGLTGVYWSFFY